MRGRGQWKPSDLSQNPEDAEVNENVIPVAWLSVAVLEVPEDESEFPAGSSSLSLAVASLSLFEKFSVSLSSVTSSSTSASESSALSTK